MPNDAKLALVIGVGLVVAVAILFYHKDLVGGRSPDDKSPASVGNPPASPAPSSSGGQRRAISARPMGRSADAESSAAPDRGDEEKPMRSRTSDASVHGLTGP
jgi:hypothetical protein